MCWNRLKSSFSLEIFIDVRIRVVNLFSHTLLPYTLANFIFLSHIHAHSPSNCLMPNLTFDSSVIPFIFLPGSIYPFHRAPRHQHHRQHAPMLENRCRSTPCRFPGSPRTRSRRPWCRSPCRRGSCSRLPGRQCSSSSSRPPTCTRRTRPGPPPCCKEWGIRRRGRPRCSGRSSLGPKTKPWHYKKNVSILFFFFYKDWSELKAGQSESEWLHAYRWSKAAGVWQKRVRANEAGGDQENKKNTKEWIPLLQFWLTDC